MDTGSRSAHLRFYLRKYGIVGLSRLVLSRLWTATFGRWEWLYSIELKDDRLSLLSSGGQSGLTIVPYENAEQLDEPTMGQLRAFKSDLSLKRFLTSWFERGAVLWLTRRGSAVVGLQWTLQGGMSGLYSVPIGPREVIIVAVEVFPGFRGQGLCPDMLRALFRGLSSMGVAKAYLKVASSNAPMIRSMQKTECSCLGKVYTVTTAPWTFCIWRNPTVASRRDSSHSAKRAAQ